MEVDAQPDNSTDPFNVSAEENNNGKQDTAPDPVQVPPPADDKADNTVSPAAGGNSKKRKRKKLIKPKNTTPTVSGNPQDNVKEEGQDDKGKSPATGKNSISRMKKKKKKAATDKPEASTKDDAGKKESMGMIFMCSSKTKKDCYHYKVLGLPAAKKDMVANIYKGMRLFLFDVDLKLLYGIYKAAEPGGYNIEPKAFNSAFPSQVRFTVFEDCLPLAEEKFKAVIKDNYYAKNKFDCQLKAEQVKNLCKLFKATTGKSREPEVRSFADRSRERGGQGRDRVRRPGQERERRQGRRDREMHRSRIIDRRHGDNRVRLMRPDADAVYDNQAVILPPRLAYAYERPTDIEYHRRDSELSRREDIVYLDHPHGQMEPPDRYLPFQEPLYTRALPSHEAALVYSRRPPPAHETPVSYHESVYARDAPPVYILPHTGYRF